MHKRRGRGGRGLAYICVKVIECNTRRERHKIDKQPEREREKWVTCRTNPKFTQLMEILTVSTTEWAPPYDDQLRETNTLTYKQNNSIIMMISCLEEEYHQFITTNES